MEGLEMDAWLDLAGIYRDLGSWSDSEICLQKAKSISRFSSRCWHERGQKKKIPFKKYSDSDLNDDDSFYYREAA